MGAFALRSTGASVLWRREARSQESGARNCSPRVPHPVSRIPDRVFSITSPDAPSFLKLRSQESGARSQNRAATSHVVWLRTVSFVFRHIPGWNVLISYCAVESAHSVSWSLDSRFRTRIPANDFARPLFSSTSPDAPSYLGCRSQEPEVRSQNRAATSHVVWLRTVSFVFIHIPGWNVLISYCALESAHSVSWGLDSRFRTRIPANDFARPLFSSTSPDAPSYLG
jgi:hypothetical protein